MKEWRVIQLLGTEEKREKERRGGERGEMEGGRWRGKRGRGVGLCVWKESEKRDEGGIERERISYGKDKKRDQ